VQVLLVGREGQQCVAESGKSGEASRSCKRLTSINDAFVDTSGSVVVTGNSVVDHSIRPMTLRFSASPLRLKATVEKEVLGFAGGAELATNSLPWKTVGGNTENREQGNGLVVEDKDAVQAVLSGERLYVVERRAGRGGYGMMVHERRQDGNFGGVGTEMDLSGCEAGTVNISGIWISPRGGVIVATEVVTQGRDRSVPGWRDMGTSFCVFEIAAP
jgi:hypothetical protein